MTELLASAGIVDAVLLHLVSLSAGVEEHAAELPLLAGRQGGVALKLLFDPEHLMLEEQHWL